jgi:hypothetical protein
VSGDGVSELTNGNLKVSVDVNGLLTAIRVSDGKVLLKQTAMTFAQPNVPVTRAGSVSAMVSFAGTANEKVYGLGEHRTGVVNQMPYHKRFADSQDYGQSHGSDVSMPWCKSRRRPVSTRDSNRLNRFRYRSLVFGSFSHRRRWSTPPTVSNPLISPARPPAALPWALITFARPLHRRVEPRIRLCVEFTCVRLHRYF